MTEQTKQGWRNLPDWRLNRHIADVILGLKINWMYVEHNNVSGYNYTGDLNAAMDAVRKALEQSPEGVKWDFHFMITLDSIEAWWNFVKDATYDRLMVHETDNLDKGALIICKALCEWWEKAGSNQKPPALASPSP